MREVILVKLGGSLITDKKRPDTPRLDVIERLAHEVADVLPSLNAGLILGHGGGSFGHVAAARSRVDRGLETPEQIEGFAHTQERVGALHALVVTALREAGVPVFSVAPGSAAVTATGRMAAFFAEPILLALERTLVPVLYGDVVMDRDRGAAILSTELIFSALVEALQSRDVVVRMVLWLGETAGVYDETGATVARISSSTVANLGGAVGRSGSTDVTGGMAHRLEVALGLAARGVSSWIGDGRQPNRWIGALEHTDVEGTIVVPPTSREVDHPTR